MYYDSGIMDSVYMWTIEDEYCTLFGLKADSYTFHEIHETGYEEYYLENREIIKTIDMQKYISTDEDYLIVLGFMHLKYQIPFPNQLKINLLQYINKHLIKYDTENYKEENDFWKNKESHLRCFKNSIEKEDGQGLTNVGSILPKRTLYE